MEYKPSFSNTLRSDIRPSYKDSITHHGIKGMKWGVRRYQNPDGSYTAIGKAKRNYKSKNNHTRQIAAGIGIASAALAIYGGVYLHKANHEYGRYSTITSAPLKEKLDDFGTSKTDVKLPKGTKFQRISTEANEDYIQRGHTYVSNNFHDNLVYRNKMPSVLGKSRPYIHTLKSNSEVRAPSRRVAAETYLGMRPRATHAEYKNFMTYGIRENSDTQKEFVSRLNKAGYNAVIDENDAGDHGIARQPLILLNPDVTTTGVHRMSLVEKVLANI